MLEKLMYIAIKGLKVDDFDATSSIDYWLSSILDPQHGRNKWSETYIVLWKLSKLEILLLDTYSGLPI